MDKPDSCRQCPWYQDGKGFVTNEPVRDVYLLQSSPSRIETDTGLPAQGQSGKDLDHNFLPLAGLVRGLTASVGTVLHCRWAGQDDLPGDAVQDTAVQYCGTVHFTPPTSARCIVVQGDLAFKFAHGGLLRDPNGKAASLGDWRGFVLPHEYTQSRFGSIPVYVTMAVADLYTNPSMETVTEWDFLKLRRILDGDYPRPLPENIVMSPGTLQDTRDWFREAGQSRWVVCDTEFVPDSKYLTMVGLLQRRWDGTTKGLQIDWRTSSVSVREEFKYHYRKLITHVPFIFHNCRADVPVLEQAIGPSWDDYLAIEDTMLAHAVVWCELPHGLEFIASVWGHYPKLKHLKNNNELLYNLGDVLETDAIWLSLIEESFKHDPQAEAIYRTQHLLLCPLLDRTIRRGLRVNRERVLSAQQEYEARVRQALSLAEVGAGWPINLNSNQQVSMYLYTVRGFDAQLNKKTGNSSIDDEAIARLRMALGPYFDPDEELTYAQALERIEHGADPILEARVLYAGASTRLIKYIYPMYQAVSRITPWSCASKGAAKKARDLAITRVKAGVETAILDRIHPDMLIHTQKTGRWSTVDPPIAQLPADLRDLVCPDPGEVWISWDWSAIEPRILEAYCGSRILRRAFDDGIDLHTWTMCAVLGYEFPPDLIDPHKNPSCQAWRDTYKWKGKDDPRRVFAKQARYEMYYGGTGQNAANAASLFGLDLKVLKRACTQLISADPEYAQWRANIEEQIKRTRVLRTFMGRPRRFLKGGHKMIREGLDQPMQGGVSDIANTTIILLNSLGLKGFQFAWSMHDSQKWHCPRELVSAQFMDTIRGYCERPHSINGRVTAFPIDLGILYPPGELEIAGLESYTHH